MGRLERLRGAYRLWWGFCPKCNSDAPHKYDCDVCREGLKFRRPESQSDDGYFLKGWPPSSERKLLWWRRFTGLKHSK